MDSAPRVALASPARPYVLGTGPDELERLSHQHRLWSDAATAAWRRAGLLPGQRVLDVGCGPGFAAFDLAELVSRRGSVVGVDESTSFIEFMRTQARARGLDQVEGLAGDAHELGHVLQGRSLFDHAWVRWVLCFAKAPERILAGVAAALRPGGRVVVFEYFNYEAMTLAPRRASHDRAVEATARSWRDRGGDPDVGGRVPRMLADCGLRVVHVQVHQRIARGGDAMFEWPRSWWQTYAPKLVETGFLRQTDCDELLRDLDEVGQSNTDFVCCPPVYEIIAEKPEPLAGRAQPARS